MKKIAWALASQLVFASFAAAQEAPFPSKTVTLVAPFAAGGAVDLLARLVAENLTKDWGTQVIVENRPGAGTAVAAGHVFRAKPDGYTLLLATNTTLVTNAVLNKDLPYQPKQFTPIGVLAQGPLVLLTSAKQPLQSFAQFRDYAQAHPGKVSMASVGAGTTSHIVMEYLKQTSKLQIEHIPYNGVSQLLPSLISGDVHAFFDTTATGMNHAKNPAIKAIAVTSKNRMSKYPDIPTIAEQGYPNFDMQIWYALVSSPDTPPAVVQKVQASIAAFSKTPAYLSKLEQLDMEITPSGADFLTNKMQADTQMITSILRSTDLAKK